jgi:hypothetical protein
MYKLYIQYHNWCNSDILTVYPTFHLKKSMQMIEDFSQINISPDINIMFNINNTYINSDAHLHHTNSSIRHTGIIACWKSEILNLE